jgi:hypothetical protein
VKAKRNLLLALLAVCALLGVGLFAVTSANTKAEQEAEAAEQGTIPLSVFSVDDLTEIVYTYNEETIALSYSDGVWTLEDDPDYNISQSQCNTMATSLCALYAKRSMEVTAGEDYGTEAPIVSVTVTAAGQSTTLNFGDTNSITGDIYVQIEGNELVYTASSSKVACFEYSKTDLFDPFNPTGITRSALESIEYDFTSADESFSVHLQAMLEPVVSEDGEDEGSEETPDADSESTESDDTTEYQTVWRLVSDPTVDLDSDAMDVLLSALATSVSGQITHPESLNYYGLDAPLLTVRATTDEGTTTVYYAIGTDGYYMKVEGDDSVYSVDADTIAAFCLNEEELAA